MIGTRISKAEYTRSATKREGTTTLLSTCKDPKANVLENLVRFSTSMVFAKALGWHPLAMYCEAWLEE